MFGRRWHDAQARIARALKDTVAHRWLGERLFGEPLWFPHRSSVASGIALGLFIAFTPTIPFQMFLAATLAVLLRINVPAAVVGVWVTNPVTALPIYVTASRLGRRLLRDTGLLEMVHDFFVSESRSAVFFDQAICLWAGGLVLGGASAFLGWSLVHLIWRTVARKLSPASR